MKTIAVNSYSQGEGERMYPKSLIPEAKKGLSPAKKDAIAGSKTDSKAITIFLVDDNLFYLKALEHSIAGQKQSIDIKTFQTGEECLEQMQSKPEIVILDYYLNSNVNDALDGLTILKKIKKISPKTKVIMLSAQDSLDIAVKCAENGSLDYIIKDESAFIKINKELSNIIEQIKIDDESLKPYQIISILIIIIILISLLLR